MRWGPCLTCARGAAALAYGGGGAHLGAVARAQGGCTEGGGFPGRKRRRRGECGELAEEEGKEGGVEPLPALEEEEGDVEGGSGRGEGLLKKMREPASTVKAPD